jgi:hypothetical protein
MKTVETPTENECACDCEGCQAGNCQEQHPRKEGIFWQMRLNDTVGAAFLGTLAILMLMFLVRANRRNRELLLEVIQLRRQT